MRLVPVIAALLLLSGCSGLGRLMIWNRSGQDALVSVLSAKGDDPRGDEKSVGRGDEVETIHWSPTAPDWIEVSVKFEDGTAASRRWLRADYPDKMREGTSAPMAYVVEIHSGSMTLRDPTGFDAFRRHMGTYSAVMAVIAGAAFWGVLRARGRRGAVGDSASC